MLRKGALALTAIAVAGLIGWGTALVRLRWFVGLGDVVVGPWQTSTQIGSVQADAVLRAAVAVNAILAMNRDEAIYFTAHEDSSGRALNGACRYRIIGTDPAARWWSVTVYGEDRFLVPNAAHRYSASRNSVSRDAEGSFSVRLSQQKPADVADGDWVALPNGGFLLTLRLYHPAPAWVDDPEHARLPDIIAENCP